MIKYAKILAKAKSYELLSKADQLDPKKRKAILESEIALLQSDLTFSQSELARVNKEINDIIKNSRGKPSSILLSRKSSIEVKIHGLQSDIDGLQKKLDIVLKEQITSRLKKIITSEQIRDVAKKLTLPENEFASVAAVVRYFLINNYSIIETHKFTDELKKAIKEIHEVLIRAHMNGVIELRPESGMGLLSPKDAVLCIPGPRGSILSTIKIKKPAKLS